jgi:nucleotide-binding universal stress UspA family protein
MHTIIVPTDFSTTTSTALRVAGQLAELSGLTVTAVHFHGPATAAITKRGDLADQQDVQKKLEEFIRFTTSPASDDNNAPMSEAVRSKLTPKIVFEDPANGLVRLSKDPDTALIVMGASGAGVANDGGIFYGSVAKAVSLKGESPVLLLPKGYDTIRFEKIAYSFKQEAPLRAVHNRVGGMLSGLNAKTYYTHLEHDNPDEERKETAFLQDPSKTDFMEADSEVNLMEVGILTKRLGEFTRANDIDLLIMGRTKRGPIESFFIDTEVKPLLNSCNIPLLIVPVEK